MTTVEIEGIKLRNVHDPSKCAGRPCVIHAPLDHHMRDWPLHWRDDRGIFERICGHGVGHPDPSQFAYWDEQRQSWRPSIADDVIDDRIGESNPWECMGVHGCDSCCWDGEQ